MRKRIGIVGGVSPATTIEYYDGIAREYHARFQDIAYHELFALKSKL